MKRTFFSSLCALVLLNGCAGSPPSPDWKLNAANALTAYEQHWLEGGQRNAHVHFERAQAEIARSGRTDLAARAELIRCAANIASLNFEPCSGFAARADDASAADLAYARLLAGDWTNLDAELLPAHYAPLLKATDSAARQQALSNIAAPLPRLIAAALLLQRGEVMPEGIRLATETASERGWRRPLMAWLLLQRQRASAAGDQQTVARLDRRIALVETSASEVRAP